jgi:hypothetical protein
VIERVRGSKVKRRRGRRSGWHPKTAEKIELAREILEAHHPMTLRQVFYQLVSRLVIENSVSSYAMLSRLLAEARIRGIIPWEWMEDRTRRPRTVSMWDDLPDYGNSMLHWYRRNVWADQPSYVEVWLEKDALSGIFENILDPYGVTLNVGRGFDGWSSLNEAADRYRQQGGDDVSVVDGHIYSGDSTILYFGDFDPSGEDMVRSLKERLGAIGAHPEIIKCALTRDDIDRYHLPPMMTKKKDTRAKAFIAKHGDIAVELDALPVDVLTSQLVDEVEARMDLDALEATRELEKQERQRLREMLVELE